MKVPKQQHAFILNIIKTLNVCSYGLIMTKKSLNA
jgi:hypothetical protein